MSFDSNFNPLLLTDKYEFTMLETALKDGVANKKCVFEIFARRLPPGRRYGVVCGTGRILAYLDKFHFNTTDLEILSEFVNPVTLDWLKKFHFSGNIYGYREGDIYFPNSPIMIIEATFGEAVLLETLFLSILNFDSAVAAAAARMKIAAGENKPVIEMGSRRTHELAAVAAARAAYIAGFSATSNITAASTYNIPCIGTSAHAFSLLYSENGPNEISAFQAQISAYGPKTTLLVDTFDINTGVKNAIKAAGIDLQAIRIDSGDLGLITRNIRKQLDNLGAKNTKIMVSGDLDEFAIASLKSEPINSFGAGTSVVTGSGNPTANLVYKLVEVEGKPVKKYSFNKETWGGKKNVLRFERKSGIIYEEIIYSSQSAPPQLTPTAIATNPLIELVRNGEILIDYHNISTARTTLSNALQKLPWEALSLNYGEPVLTAKML